MPNANGEAPSVARIAPLRIRSDALIERRDALPVPRYAPRIRSDALPVPRDALHVPRDALRIRGDAVPRRGRHSRRVTRSSLTLRAAGPIPRERERMRRELFGA